MKVGLRLMRSVVKALDKNVFATASAAAGAGIQNKIIS